MSELMDDLTWRGLVHQVTDPELGKLLHRDSLTLYIGFDPTADSLHMGHLVQLLNLSRFQRCGHRPIALAGGGTGLVGDPSGRSDERNLLTRDQLDANLKAIRDQLERFLDFDRKDGSAAQLVNNGDWLWELGLLEFLRDVGKQFTVNQMVAKESVKARLNEREQGISYTEFSYMLLQAYDFLHLFDTHGCRLQAGASDQWGNITMGIDLIRRHRGAHVFGLTTPILTTADGTKMGKTAAGAVWLDPARTSPYAFYQHLIRTEDVVVGAHLRALTFLERGRIEELDAAVSEAPERREAQRALAWEVTSLVHGEAEASKARHASEVLFSEEIAGLDEATLLEVFAEAPSSDRPRAALDGDGLPLVDALADAGLYPSKGQARKALEGGGASVNNRKVADAARALTRDDLIHDRYIIVRKGKRDHHLLRFE